MVQKNIVDQNLESWLNQVQLSKSGSKSTALSYRFIFSRFLKFIGKTSEEILQEYESQPEKTFKRFYATAINNFVMAEKNRGLSSNSYGHALSTIKSFFKYNSLPLNFIATINPIVENHNRDITQEEINEVLKLSEYRERAFYILCAQSGLRPDTLVKLKVENVEKILEEDTPIPCLINIPQESTNGKYGAYFTFCGQESVTALKTYFKTRGNVKLESYVFSRVCEEGPVNAGVFSHFFNRTIMRLQKKHILTVKTNRKEMTAQSENGYQLKTFITRNDLRLYNLRKFFRKYAGQSGSDYVNFWMGHLNAMGVDLRYFSKDIEMHRAIYKDKAMPFLRIETKTPSETEKQIESLSQENKALKEQLSDLNSKLADLRAERVGTDEKMQYFSTRLDAFETYIRHQKKEEKKKKKDDIGIDFTMN